MTSPKKGGWNFCDTMYKGAGKTTEGEGVSKSPNSRDVFYEWHLNGGVETPIGRVDAKSTPS